VRWGNKFYLVVHFRDGIQRFLVQMSLILDTYSIGPRCYVSKDCAFYTTSARFLPLAPFKAEAVLQREFVP
jgi:hypothetical protein